VTDWLIPLLSTATVVVWMDVARRRFHHPGAMVAVIGVAMILTVASVVYPGLIDTDTNRFLVSLGRVFLCATGVAVWVQVWWSERTPEVEP